MDLAVFASTGVAILSIVIASKFFLLSRSLKIRFAKVINLDEEVEKQKETLADLKASEDEHRMKSESARSELTKNMQALKKSSIDCDIKSH
jgi:hypothetical protein